VAPTTIFVTWRKWFRLLPGSHHQVGLQSNNCAKIILKDHTAIRTGFPKTEGFNDLAGAFPDYAASRLLLKVVKLSLEALFIGFDDASGVSDALDDDADALAAVRSDPVVEIEHFLFLLFVWWCSLH
jgi:hypothetical protein